MRSGLKCAAEAVFVFRNQHMHTLEHPRISHSGHHDTPVATSAQSFSSFRNSIRISAIPSPGMTSVRALWCCVLVAAISLLLSSRLLARRVAVERDVEDHRLLPESVEVGHTPQSVEVGDVLCGIGDLHGDPIHARAALRLCGAVIDGVWTRAR